MKFYLLTILICLLFLQSNVYAQTSDSVKSISLKKQINTILSSEIQKETDEIFKRENLTLSQKQPIFIDSDSTIIQESLALKVEESKDSILVEHQEEDVEVLVETPIFIDTVKIKKRFKKLKNKHFGEQYSEKEWQKKNNLMSLKSYEGNYTLKNDKIVFGWHPFWVGNAYESYNFSLLNTISYFSYELDPKTGDYITIHDWETTALIDSAQKYDTDVLLTVTNFGNKNNITFLSNSNKQFSKIAKQLITLLKKRQAAGVNIDFENIPKSVKSNFTNFLIGLSNELQKEDYKLVVTLPPKDFEHIYEIEKISSYVDFFVIMGYEFYGQNSQIAGPVAPIGSGDFWWEFNIERAIQEYIVDGLSPKKTVLACPLYGADWVTHDLKFPSEVKYFDKYLSIKQIHNKLGNIEPQREEHSGSAYHVYRDGNGEYHQIWFEDSVTLQKKVDLITEYELKGIGFWALGYDNGLPDTWEVIAKNFTEKQPVEQLATVNFLSLAHLKKTVRILKKILSNPTSFLKNSRSVILLFSGLFGLNLMMILSFFVWKHRLNKLLKLFSITTMVVLFFIVVCVFMLINNWLSIREVLLMIGGITSGGIVFFIISYNYFFQRELP